MNKRKFPHPQQHFQGVKAMSMKQSKTLMLAGSLLAATLAVPALAAEGGFTIFTTDYVRAMKSQKMMDMMDENKDHMVSKTEWTDYHAKLFDMMDKNKDGMVDKGEWQGGLGGIGGKGTS
jgi:hypothetical protein